MRREGYAIFDKKLVGRMPYAQGYYNAAVFMVGTVDSCEKNFELDNFMTDFWIFMSSFRKLFEPCRIVVISLVPKGFCRY